MLIYYLSCIGAEVPKASHGLQNSHHHLSNLMEWHSFTHHHVAHTLIQYDNAHFAKQSKI